MKSEVVDISPELSAKIRNMSIVCALMVVCIHCQASVNPKHDVFWLMQLTTCTLCEIAVPYFFMISGFMLAGKMGDGHWWRRELLKRVKSLLIPFVIATVLYMAFTVPIDAIKDLRHGDILRHNPFAQGRILEILGLDFSLPPIVAPLWYLRALFLLVVFSPLVKWLVDATRGLFVPVAFIVYYLYCPIVDGEPIRAEVGQLYGIFRYGFSLEGLAYFSLGIVLRRRLAGIDWSGIKVKMLAILLGASGLLMSIYRTYLLYVGVQPGIHWTDFVIPAYMFALFAFMPSKSFPAVLVGNSFGIFLIHFFPNFLYSRIVAKIAKHWHTMLFNFVFVVLVSLFVCEVLRRKCPRFAKTLFGGR